MRFPSSKNQTSATEVHVAVVLFEWHRRLGLATSEGLPNVPSGELARALPAPTHRQQRYWTSSRKAGVESFVLDASVALPWFLDNPMPTYAKRVKQLLIRGERAVVPALWHLEMSNGLAMAERRSILTKADIDQAMIDIEQIVAQAVDTDSGASISTVGL